MNFPFKGASILILFSVLAFTGCNNHASVENANKNTTIPQYVKYEIIDHQSNNFNNSKNSEIKNWYDKNYKLQGLHRLTINDDDYLLLCAGEKNTGGFQIQDVLLENRDESINITALLSVPDKNQSVIMMITYPHILIKIPKTNKNIDFIGFNESTQQQEEKMDSGYFVGMADGHTIEIKISGVPESKATRSFQLSDSIISSWNELNINENDSVRFTYIEKNKIKLITHIEKITN